MNAVNSNNKMQLKQRQVAGAPGISQQACYAQRCCFQPASAGSRSKCYRPYNAEISAYHAVAVSQGYVGPLGSETLLLHLSQNLCKHFSESPKVLQLVLERSSDKWNSSNWVFIPLLLATLQQQ